MSAPKPPEGPPPRRASFSPGPGAPELSMSMYGPLPVLESTQLVHQSGKYMSTVPNHPIGRHSFVAPTGIPQLNGRLGVPSKPDAPRGPAPMPPRGPPPRGPPPRGPPPLPHGPPGHYLGRPSILEPPFPPGQYSRRPSVLGTSASSGGQPTMPQMTPIRNPPNSEQLKPSAPPLPSPLYLQMPQMTPISVPPTDQSTIETPAKSMMINNRPSQPSPIGKPPPHVHSQVPPITPLPQLAYGKLVIRILKGLNLKAGQGVFGRADPFVRMKLGNNEATTNPHMDGGRNPEWKEEFEFEITTEKEIEIEVIDKEVIGEDKLMGYARVGILDWIAQGNYEGSINVFDKLNSHAGQIAVSVSFYRQGTYPQKSHLSPTSPTQQDIVINKAKVPEKDTHAEDEFTEKEIVDAFRAFDLDKNNYVGAAEIRHVLLNIGERPTEEEVDEMIRMVDKNGDGQVAFDEFYRMVTGGRDPPAGLRESARYSSIIGDNTTYIGGLSQIDGGVNSTMMSPTHSGPDVIKARNAKRKSLDEFTTENNLKPESIKRAHRRFQVLDKKKAGVMDYPEFCEVLQVEPSVLSEDVFKLYDYAGSGLIDAKEVLIALANFTGAGKDDKMKFAFMLYDEESTGSITHRELVKILRANHMAKTEAEVSRKAETIIAQCDKRNDGIITFDEFVVVAKKFPNILFPAQRR